MKNYTSKQTCEEVKAKERKGRGTERKRKRSGAYGAVYGLFLVRAGSPFLRRMLIEKVIELVTCVPNTKQRAEETNELVICPEK